MGIAPAQAQTTYPKGAAPEAGVIRDSAGNLYGTTAFGGTANMGVVYKVDTTGHERVMHTFTGPDGDEPYAGVIADSDGNLYGTTAIGGTANAGVVFKVDTAAQETVLYSFTGGADGSIPNVVIRDPAGNLYGSTAYGGTANAGVVFKLDMAGKYTVLYTFTGGADGNEPNAVTRDSAGNLYGTTYQGGTAGFGVVFKLEPANQAPWPETVLYTFTGGADGGEPLEEYGALTQDAAGNLYGTTYLGGTANVGVVFKLEPASQAPWPETVLYSFTGGADGGYPGVGVIREPSGNLYGTTGFGGDLSCVQGFGSGCGVVFKMSPTGQETVLYTFTGADGAVPQAGVIRDSAGNLYGTTYAGGDPSCNSGFGCGVVFKLEPGQPGAVAGDGPVQLSGGRTIELERAGPQALLSRRGSRLRIR
jgi:uncharacterized repeat protein (TIGR03803 family)